VGQFAYRVGAHGLDGDDRTLNFSVAAGANTNLDVTDTAGQRAIRLLPSSNRMLPDLDSVPGMSIQVGAASPAPGQTPDSEPYAVPSKPLLVIASPSDDVLVFTAAAKFASFAFTPGVQDIPLARLDLNHVRVSLGDGTTAQVPGSVEIQTIPNFVLVADSLATGHGLDLPKGNYLVTTSYVHPVTQEQLSTSETIELK
jgi:hypothetical protein